MAFQYGTGLRDGKMDSVNTTLGATATLKVFSGAEPGSCGVADPSGLLVTINLPNPPFAASSSGAIAKTGVWSGSAANPGTAASWRIYDSSAVCQIQGNTTDMTFDNTSIAGGQTVTVSTFQITSGNG